MSAVTIDVRFTGSIARLVGKDSMRIRTSPELEAAIADVKRQMKGAAKDVLYTMLISGMHYSIAIQQGIKLKDGDEITVIPVTLGG